MNMKRSVTLVATVTMVGFSTMTHASHPNLNLGFETGSLQHWRSNIPRGKSEFSTHSRLAGTTQVASTWGQQVGMSPLRSAIEGNHFAAIGSLDDGYFTGDCSYNITLTRSIHLFAGETISGSSFFYNGDYEAQDSAWVKILNTDGCAISQPWFESSGVATATTPYRTASSWVEWSWEAPEDSVYSLVLGMTTGGDNVKASYGFFDDIRVNAATPINTSSVPEPSSLSLIALGATGLAALRRKKHA